MPIMIQNSKTKLMCAGEKIAKMYCEGDVIYSSGNICTYYVDSGITYQEEVDEGASCLSPKTFTPAKSEWTFVGWRSDATANPDVYTSLVMGDAPVTLYAVFVQAVTLSTIANGVTSSQSKNRVYNNGNVANPAFTVSNPSKSGASFLGWSSGAGSTAISNSTISNLTLSASTTRWAVFKYADATYHVSTTLVYPRQNSNEGSNPAKVALGSVPSIDTTKYGSVSFFTGGGGANANIVRLDNSYNYTYCQASLVIGNNSVILGTAERIGSSDDAVTVDIRNKTYTLNLSINGTQTIYIQGYVAGGNGFNKGTIYIANNYDSANNTSITFIGRTVVG